MGIIVTIYWILLLGPSPVILQVQTCLHVLHGYIQVMVGWLFWGLTSIFAIFQPYLDLEAGDNQSLKIQVARSGIEPRSSCSASQELNHSATAAPYIQVINERLILCIKLKLTPPSLHTSHALWLLSYYIGNFPQNMFSYIQIKINFHLLNVLQQF